jgi:trk system potassium uptake protein TrkH
MLLTRYIMPLDLRAVLTHLGVVSKLLGVVLLLPFLVALLTGDLLHAAVFGVLALGTYLIGRLAAAVERPVLALKEALVVTALAYLSFGLVGALAFLPDTSFLDGFFEAMSGFTTTGLSVMDIAHLPKSLLFFRAYAQWVGGAGIIVLSLAVFFGPGKAAFQLYASEFKEDNVLGSVITTARVVAMLYVGLTGLGLVVYLVTGMQPFEALLHVMATLSTGGFSPYPESIGKFRSSLVTWAVIGFMLLGATSFPLYYLIRLHGPGRFWRDRQMRALLGLIALATLVFVGLRGWHLENLTSSVFRATSALTTTGFNLTDTTSWSEGSKLVTVFLMIIGGSAGSTAGGIKVLRLLILARLLGWFVLRELLPPEAQIPMKYGELVVSDHELKQHVGFFILYVGLVFVTTVPLVCAGFPTIDALFESASALGTVGLSTGITSPDLTAWLKLVLIFDMWAGRLEILPVLIVLYPGTWKRRGRTG